MPSSCIISLIRMGAGCDCDTICRTRSPCEISKNSKDTVSHQQHSAPLYSNFSVQAALGSSHKEPAAPYAVFGQCSRSAKLQPCRNHCMLQAEDRLCCSRRVGGWLVLLQACLRWFMYQTRQLSPQMPLRWNTVAT